MIISRGFAIYFDAIAGIVSANTIKFYRDRLPSLIEMLGDVELDGITLADLRLWRAWLCERPIKVRRKGSSNRLSPYTLHQYVRCARRFFRWLHDEGIAATNPAARLELPPLPDRKPRGITLADVKLLLLAADCDRDIAIVLFLADTACRVCGASRLRLDDLHTAEGYAVVREKGRGGYGRARVVFFTPTTAAALAAWLDARGKTDCEYVFTGRRGGRLCEGGIYQMLERLANKAGVTSGCNPHNFRHGALRALLENGMSLPEVSQIAGHSSVQVTGDIYGFVAEGQLHKRHDQLSWLAF